MLYLFDMQPPQVVAAPYKAIYVPITSFQAIYVPITSFQAIYVPITEYKACFADRADN